MLCSTIKIRKQYSIQFTIDNIRFQSEVQYVGIAIFSCSGCSFRTKCNITYNSCGSDARNFLRIPFLLKNSVCSCYYECIVLLWALLSSISVRWDQLFSVRSPSLYCLLYSVCCGDMYYWTVCAAIFVCNVVLYALLNGVQCCVVYTIMFCIQCAAVMCELWTLLLSVHCFSLCCSIVFAMVYAYCWTMCAAILVCNILLYERCVVYTTMLCVQLAGLGLLRSLDAGCVALCVLLYSFNATLLTIKVAGILKIFFKHRICSII